MPDFSHPPRPRPKHKIASTGQPIFYDSSEEWGEGTEVFLYNEDGTYTNPENEQQFEVDGVTITISNGCIG